MKAARQHIGTTCSDCNTVPKKLKPTVRPQAYRLKPDVPADREVGEHALPDVERTEPEYDAAMSYQHLELYGYEASPLHEAARHVQTLLNTPRVIIFSNLIKGPSWFQDEKECIEAAAIDMRGTVLLNTLIRPSSPISMTKNHSIYRHCITNEMLDAAPAWPEVFEQVQSILSMADCIVTYSPEFTIAEFEESSNIWGIDPLHWPEVKDLRQLEMSFAEKWDQEFEIWEPDTLPGRSYRALFNCFACLSLMREMARNLEI